MPFRGRTQAAVPTHDLGRVNRSVCQIGGNKEAASRMDATKAVGAVGQVGCGGGRGKSQERRCLPWVHSLSRIKNTKKIKSGNYFSRISLLAEYVSPGRYLAFGRWTVQKTHNSTMHHIFAWCSLANWLWLVCKLTSLPSGSEEQIRAHKDGGNEQLGASSTWVSYSKTKNNSGKFDRRKDEVNTVNTNDENLGW